MILNFIKLLTFHIFALLLIKESVSGRDGAFLKNAFVPKNTAEKPQRTDRLPRIVVHVMTH